MNLQSHQISSLQGELTVPGDKSISHRAAILGGLAHGTTEISNYLCSEDCLNTLKAMQQLGAELKILEKREGYGPTHFLIKGVSMNPTPPAHPIDCGNSGTGMRLMAGMLAACPFDSEMFGDDSLCSRPMGRIMNPLEQMGADIEARGEKSGCAPLFIHAGTIHPIEYTLPMASAQVKSAILLAGMFAQGETIVHQPAITRDHTERLFHHFHIPCTEKGLSASVTGPATPLAQDLTVPADISSAAFWIVAAAILPGSHFTLHQVGLNPTRTAILNALARMGADISIVKTSPEHAGEPYGDITVTGNKSLHGTELLQEEISNLIDEIPILAIAAALAQGDTIIRNAHELRVKETDRIATTATNLRAMGVIVDEYEDGMVIHGGNKLKGCELPSFGDHRIAMSFLIAGLTAEGTTTLLDTECINTSYPGFAEDLQKILHSVQE
ncbi:MAG: 3-phosphoshikimate 1-carboxyvinyltransferase [Akkermansia sp.]